MQELLRLKLMTTARGRVEDEVALQISIYAEELEKYPADAVVDVLRHLGKSQKWWPAWAEVQPLLDERVKRRSALIEALMRVRMAPAPVQLPNVAKEEPTESSDPETWFWTIMVPYMRNRLPDHWAEATIRGWQANETEAAALVRALDIERKRRAA